MDCMHAMREFPDGYFDLAVVDPPYGIGADTHEGKSENGWKQWNSKGWDNEKPKIEYWRELFRVSKNQIVWGGNYFTETLPSSMCWIIWDKGQRDFSLADGELAWTSFNKAMRIFEMSRGEALAKNNKTGGRIHPTQKPVKLYEWIYMNYLPQGGKVLDTHLGSGSNRIAADKMGNIEFYGYEIDKEYFDASVKRFEQYKAQLTMF